MKKIRLFKYIAIGFFFIVHVSPVCAITLMESGPGSATNGDYVMINNITLAEPTPSDYIGVFDILGVNVSGLNGTGSVDLYIQDSTGQGVTFGFIGSSTWMNTARTEYYEPVGPTTQIEERHFAIGEVTPTFDFRLFFYNILETGQWRFRSQYRMEGGSWNIFNEGPYYHWVDTAFVTPPGNIDNGLFGLRLSGWDGGVLTYENIMVTKPGGLTPIPEPATMLLLGLGLIGLAGAGRKFKK